MVSRRNVQCNSEVTLRNIYLFICIEAVSGVMPWLRLLLFYVHNIGMQFFSFEYSVHPIWTRSQRCSTTHKTSLMHTLHGSLQCQSFFIFFSLSLCLWDFFSKNVTINIFRVQSSRPRIHKRSEFDTSTAQCRCRIYWRSNYSESRVEKICEFLTGWA